MAFQKRKNRHDEWLELLNSNVATSKAVDLPESVFHSEDRFIQLLSEGKLDGEVVDLMKMPDEQFQRLEAAVNSVFHDGWTQTAFAVFSAERLRRFGRYA